MAYIGREYDAETRAYKLTADPAVCISHDNAGKETAEAQRVREFVQRGELLAADKATAAFCGVAFVELELRGEDGWGLKAAPKKASDKGAPDAPKGGS